MARWLSWLERRPVTAEVVGSSPIRVVYSFGQQVKWLFKTVFGGFDHLAAAVRSMVCIMGS